MTAACGLAVLPAKPQAARSLLSEKQIQRDRSGVTSRYTFDQARKLVARPRPHTDPVKAVFIDCNDQFDAVFARVYRPDDPPITVNTTPVPPTALPDLVAGYDICLDDHSYMPTELVARCSSLKHIVFLGTGASSYMDVGALAARGVTVHTKGWFSPAFGVLPLPNAT